MEIAPVFRKALEKNRDHFNQLFVLARHEHRRLDGDEFAAQLTGLLMPLCVGVEQASGEEASLSMTEELYPLLLDLAARDYLSSRIRRSAVLRVWQDLLPQLAPLLAGHAQFLTARLCNAALSLARTPGTRLGFWLERMALAGGQAGDVDQLLAAGQVAAWRAGMAMYRESALSLCPSLPGMLLRTVLDLPSGADTFSLEDILDQLQDPWALPGEEGGRQVRIMAELGGFRGLGGPFLRPPVVRRVGDAILAEDRDQRWQVHADRFGAVLTRHSSREESVPLPDDAGTPGRFGLSSKGVVNLGSEYSTFGELAEASAFASTPHTLAVALPVSHRIFILAHSAGGRA